MDVMFDETAARIRKADAKAGARERVKARRTMDQLEAISEYDWGYCIGMEGLMWHFGKLIAE
jgi:RNA polymerase-binding transcription factor DksA